jgi:DNA mismatch endonuclease (patch repair protein)
MKGNRGKDTKPELLVRRLLREAGYPGYRLHWKKAPGRPDITYPGRKVAIFVNGCYWHACPHCGRKMPKAHPEYWEAKFAANEERDARKRANLESEGWRVEVVWECQLREDPCSALSRIVVALRGEAANGRSQQPAPESSVEPGGTHPRA